MSKSEKADLKVLTCTPLSSAPEGPMSTVAEKFLYRRALRASPVKTDQLEGSAWNLMGLQPLAHEQVKPRQ